MFHFRYHSLVEHVVQWEVGAEIKVFWAVMPNVVYMKIEASGYFETLILIYRLYRITSQKIVIFIFIAMRNSNVEVSAVHIALFLILQTLFVVCLLWSFVLFEKNICQIWINYTFTLALTFQGSCSHIKWCQFYNGTNHLQFADGGGGLPSDM